MNLIPSLVGYLPKTNLAETKPFIADCQIAATNDIQAVTCWLKKHEHNLNTFKAYQKEAKRFLMWCVYEQGKTLAELKVQDFTRYFDFLEAPPKQWCTTRDSFRGGAKTTHWRPFVGTLSPSAIKMATRVIHSLMNYLVDALYLRANPLKLMDKTHLAREERKYEVWARMLEADEWKAIQQVLERLPDKTDKEMKIKLRTQLLFFMLYFLGLRIHELANHTWNAFRYREGKWWFFVKGKGGKLGHVPVHDKLLSLLKIYRISLAKLPLPEPDEIIPIFASKSVKKLSSRQLYNIVKAIGVKASKLFPDDVLKQEKLQKFSPHWLRHLSASHQDKAGISSTMIKENLRHTSIQTTQIYLHSEDERRHQEMQKMDVSIETKLREKPEIVTQSVLSITFTGGPVSQYIGFKKLIDIIENQLLLEYTWQPIQFDKHTLLCALKNSTIPLQKIQIFYRVEGMNEGQVSQFEKALKLESDIRLFSLALIHKVLG